MSRTLAIGDKVTYVSIHLRHYVGTVMAAKGNAIDVRWGSSLGVSGEWRPNLAALDKQGKVVEGEVDEWEPSR